MNWFMDLKIAVKLLSGFVIVALVAASVGVVGIYNIQALDKSYTQVYANMTVPISELADISTEFQRSRVNVRDMILANDPLVIKSSVDSVAQRQADIAKDLESVDKTILLANVNVRELYVDLVKKNTVFNQQVALVTALANQNKDAEAMALIGETGSSGIASRELENSIANIIKVKLDDAKIMSDNNAKQASSTIVIMIMVVLVGVLIAVGLGVILSSIISKPIKLLAEAADKLAVGDVDVDISVKRKSKDELGILMGSFGKMVENIHDQVNVTEKIAAGDLSVTVNVKSDKDLLGKKLLEMQDTVKALLNETDKLIVATQAGKLDARGNAKAFSGGWGTLVGGINDLIAAFVGPINMTAEYVNRISKGDIPAKITDNYNGDFNEIKNNINQLIETVSIIIKGFGRIADNMKNGKWDDRGDANRVQNDWRTIVINVNEIVDNLVGPLRMTAEYVEHISKGDIPPKITDHYNGDFNVIKNNLNVCIDAVTDLVTDANMLVKAAVEGKLDTRADASKHGGDFGRIVDGVNKTLDAVIAPVMEASAVLEEMAKGNLNISVKGEYKGDHAKIKDALNNTISTLYSYVTEISTVLTEMADGDLNVEIEKDYRGDFAPIKKSLNNIITSLNEVLSDMHNASGQVAAGARQVSDSAQALSQGSTEQASSIEELTASMEEISTQTKLNATNATQANELALAAKEGAIKGNQQMQGMLKAMDDINESSGNISKIIKVIDEIAFQTNILALNAAVEAARAGQHGKGFAVVAEEVRNLAARSANAAKETTALIEGSIKKVEGGTKIANDTAAALNQIVEGVTKATNLVGEIATASNEQALGINQVNQGILQVSDVVQTNSATSEESAAASEELSSQAELLREQVSRFKLRKTTGSSYKGFEDLNPEVLRMLEDMAQMKKSGYSSMNQGYAEAAATSSKPRISLSDREFGKY
ncbi:MAG: methyl-accepting chemotaxis protein [Desulfosporosinus sp.]|nr:methyl-accepting chemotaxis protein [Desulfosporosinus sp.]